MSILRLLPRRDMLYVQDTIYSVWAIQAWTGATLGQVSNDNFDALGRILLKAGYFPDGTVYNGVLPKLQWSTRACMGSLKRERFIIIFKPTRLMATIQADLNPCHPASNELNRNELI